MFSRREQLRSLYFGLVDLERDQENDRLYDLALQGQPVERESFVAGYVQAHRDGEEYSCTVEEAMIAYGKYRERGGRRRPVRDYDSYMIDEGWMNE